MSKAQGDGFRTHTDVELNKYRKRLDAKLDAMRETTEKWYRGDGIVILAKSWNELENPNGDWKWNGWKVVGKTYQVAAFSEDDVEAVDGGYVVKGLALTNQLFDDRDEANAYFKMVRA